MFGLLAQFAHKAEMRESRDEMLLGEIVRAMFKKGHPSVQFHAGDDRQRVRFKTIRDPILHSVTIVLDRKTGGSALQEAILGSKATLRVTVEVKNYMADPDDLLAMYKTDLANIFKMPSIGGIKLNHELNSVFATTQKVIEINDYVGKGDVSTQKLEAFLDSVINTLKEKVAPYKKG